MASRIGKGEWVVVYAAAGLIDIIQWLLDLAIGPGEVVNEIADPLIGLALAGYFQIRGVSMFSHWNRLASLIGAVGLEMVSVSIAPAWIFDVWYIHRDVRKEDAQAQVQRQQQMALENASLQPLNQGGMRTPREDREKPGSGQALNMDGIRAPGGGIN